MLFVDGDDFNTNINKYENDIKGENNNNNNRKQIR